MLVIYAAGEPMIRGYGYDKAEMPAGFKPYTAAEIAKYRPHQLIRITETRAGLVKRLKAKGIIVPDDQMAGAPAQH